MRNHWSSIESGGGKNPAKSFGKKASVCELGEKGCCLKAKIESAPHAVVGAVRAIVRLADPSTLVVRATPGPMWTEMALHRDDATTSDTGFVLVDAFEKTHLPSTTRLVQASSARANALAASQREARASRTMGWSIQLPLSVSCCSYSRAASHSAASLASRIRRVERCRGG